MLLRLIAYRSSTIDISPPHQNTSLNSQSTNLYQCSVYVLWNEKSKKTTSSFKTYTLRMIPHFDDRGEFLLFRGQVLHVNVLSNKYL